MNLSNAFGKFGALMVDIITFVKPSLADVSDGFAEWLGTKGGKSSLRSAVEGAVKSVVTAYRDSLPPSQELEIVIDPIIRVDRSVRPVYPSWVKIVVHPELELLGLTEYSIVTVDQWLHDDQKNNGCVKGQIVYDHLKYTKVLETCLGLRDLEEIQKKGIVFFRKHFKGKAVFGMKSVVRDRDGYLCVPYLYEGGDEVVLYWFWLEGDWHSDYPALRFASSKI